MKNQIVRERTVIQIIPTNNNCRIFNFRQPIHSGSYCGEQDRLGAGLEEHPLAQFILEKCPGVVTILVHSNDMWISKSPTWAWSEIEEQLDQIWVIFEMEKIPNFEL